MPYKTDTINVSLKAGEITKEDALKQFLETTPVDGGEMLLNLTNINEVIYGADLWQNWNACSDLKSNQKLSDAELLKLRNRMRDGIEHLASMTHGLCSGSYSDKVRQTFLG